MKVEIPCPVDPERMAIFDSDLRVRMNQEIYFFSSREAMRKFQADPRRYCGMLTDPVTQTRFKPMAKSPKMMHNGRAFYFAADSTCTTFQAAPDSLSRRRGDEMPRR